MNPLNHFIFAVSLTLVAVGPHTYSTVLAVLVTSLIFSVLIDLDHLVNKRAPRHHKRTWIQEPLGLVLIGIPLATLLYRLTANISAFYMIIVPYASHILLDYLCIFEADPLSPITKRFRKKEGLGIFYPDSLVKGSNERYWNSRVNERGYRAISENYFTPIALALLILAIIAVALE